MLSVSFGTMSAKLAATRVAAGSNSRTTSSFFGARAYNAQAAADAHAQIVVAQDVTQSAVDCGQLVPMIDAVEANLGRTPEQLSVDSGYCSESNLNALESRHIDGYVATGRAKDAVADAAKIEVADEATKAATTPPQPPKADLCRGHAREDQSRGSQQPLPIA